MGPVPNAGQGSVRVGAIIGSAAFASVVISLALAPLGPAGPRQAGGHESAALLCPPKALAHVEAAPGAPAEGGDVDVALVQDPLDCDNNGGGTPTTGGPDSTATSTTDTTRQGCIDCGVPPTTTTQPTTTTSKDTATTGGGSGSGGSGSGGSGGGGTGEPGGGGSSDNGSGGSGSTAGGGDASSSEPGGAGSGGGPGSATSTGGGSDGTDSDGPNGDDPALITNASARNASLTLVPGAPISIPREGLRSGLVAWSILHGLAALRLLLNRLWFLLLPFGRRGDDEEDEEREVPST